MVFKLTVSVLGICHLLGLHFYLLISLLSSRAPNSSLHHSFSFLRDAVCLYQTWSRYLISDGQCCWCLNILLGLTSNPLDFVNLICTPHFGSFSQISAKWDPLFTICFPDTLNWQKVWCTHLLLLKFLTHVSSWHCPCQHEGTLTGHPFSAVPKSFA